MHLKNAIDVQEELLLRRIGALEAFGDRGSASPKERAAAEYLAEHLRQLGLSAELEPFTGSTTSGGRYLIHIIVAAAGIAVIRWLPGLTCILGAVALLSLIAEQMTFNFWLSKFFFRGPSQNVVAHVPSSKPPRLRLVVYAHYDTQRAGWIWEFSRRLMPLQAPLPATLKQPFLILVLMILAQIGLGIIALMHLHVPAMQYLAWLLLAGYAVMGVLLVQWLASPSVPGAADNASGVAAALHIAQEWIAEPFADDVELVVLLTGCEESMLLGAAAWADRHRVEIPERPTVVLNIDGIAFGSPRFLGAEVPAAGIALAAPQRLVDICRTVAAEQGLSDAGPHSLPGPTDTLAFLARGIEAISIVGFSDGPSLPLYHTKQDTLKNLSPENVVAGCRFATAVARKLTELE